MDDKMMTCPKHPEAGEMDKAGMMAHWEAAHQGEPMPAEAGEMPAGDMPAEEKHDDAAM